MRGALLQPMWDYTQSLPILGAEDKTARAWLPKADNERARENPPQQPIKYKALRDVSFHLVNNLRWNNDWIFLSSLY